MLRIKTNSTGAEFLYLPLEIEVTSQPGLYCPQVHLTYRPSLDTDLLCKAVSDFCI